MKFSSLSSIFAKPELAVMNESYKNMKVLHLFWRTVLRFVSENHQLPGLLSEDCFKKLLQIARQINETTKGQSPEFYIDHIEEESLRLLSRYARVQVCPLAIGWAGLVSKEILSFCGKF